jgi:homopolymeric O-antigen transport system permease protein
MKQMVMASLDCIALSWRLFARSIGAKYRKSYLGYFWMVAPAILITVGASLAGKSGIINPGAISLPYPLFVFLGTLIWQIFAEALDVPHQAFEGARSYLTRINFSREAIVLVQLYETLINTFVRLILALVLIAVFSGISWNSFGLVALSFVSAVLLGLGLGAILMPFTLLFADLHNTIKLVTSYGLFLTPAFYIPDRSGLFSTIVRWNPISPVMNSAREAAAGLPLTQLDGFIWVLTCSVILTVAGMGLVRVSAPIVIERMLLGGR